jgi:hypothetical protein
MRRKAQVWLAVQVFSPSMRVDVPQPALLTAGGISVRYSGVHDGKAVFGYRAPDLTIEDIVLFGWHHAVGGQRSAMTWQIDGANLATRYNLSPQRIAELQRDVKSALLSHPTWPREFQPNDPPLTAVEFILPK